MRQRVFDIRLQVAELAAAVETLAVELVGIDRFVVHQARDAIGELDLATGTVTRGPAVNQRVGTTVSDFPNVDLGGFIGADTGGGFCEWFDAGVKGFNGNACDLMNNFIFAYCCATLAVESGGVGGTTNLGFYEGYVTGGGTTTAATTGGGTTAATGGGG